MIALAILLLLIILVVLVLFKGNTNLRLQQLEQEVKLLRKQLAQPPAPPVAVTTPAQEKPVVPTVKSEQKEEWESGFKVITEPTTTFKKESWLPKEEPAQKPVPAVMDTNPEPQPVKEESFVLPSKITTPLTPNKPPKPTFFERNPDLEKFIGEDLVSKIGIAILVLAIGYFVKFAIDNNWIGAVAGLA